MPRPRWSEWGRKLVAAHARSVEALPNVTDPCPKALFGQIVDAMRERRAASDEPLA